MEAQKERVVSISESPLKNEATFSNPTTAETRIHWAAPQSTGTGNPELERKFEAMRARNWITDRMVQQYQKHWHCSREVALERLLSKASN